MDALNKQKRAEKRNLVRLKDEILKLLAAQTLTVENFGKLKAILVEYKGHKTTFEQVVEKVLSTADDKDPDFEKWEASCMKEVSEVADVLFTCEGRIESFQNQISSEQARSSLLPGASDVLNQTFVATANAAQPKLQKVDVPQFDGDILKFENFRRLFENLIHNCGELTNVQKLYYLKQSMIGSAADMVRDFSFEDRSYTEAWAYILSRYDNPRSVVKTLFRRLSNLKPIKSEFEIRGMLDQVDVILRGLTAAGENINDTFSRFVAFFVTTKLDSMSAREFENSVATTQTYPRYQDLQKFLQIRSFVAEDRMEFEAKPKPPLSTSKWLTSEKKNSTYEKKSALVATSDSCTSKVRCVVCSDSHYLNQCPKFKEMKVSDRFEIVKTHNLCLKCFNPFHVVIECKRFDCAKCKGRHHTMLHRERTAGSTTSNGSEKEKYDSKVSMVGGKLPTGKVYLSTVVVKVYVNGNWILARALLDNGSELNVVSRSFVKRNRIATESSNLRLIGITNTSTALDSSAPLVIRSRFSPFELSVEANVVERIPYSVVNDWKGIFSLVPGLEYGEMKLPHNEVDILLGIEHYERIIEKERHLVEGLTIRKTKFGCVVSGVHSRQKFVGLTTSEIGHQLEKFWSIEETGHEFGEKEAVVESKAVDEKFETSYRRNGEGRFVVDLLTKPGIETLNGSFDRALATLKRSERHSSIEKKRAYREFMQEYESLGHMRKLDRTEINSSSSSYYVPHHIISRPMSSTTKYRVVFNASAKDKSGSSLNDWLFVGPTLQPELFDAVIRFRKYKVAFVADIEKMYRQILINPEQRRFQRILWRPNENAPVEHYELNTVTYGTASAPYLATKCLQILGAGVKFNNPETADALTNHFYMDDLMTGHENVSKAVKLQRSIHAVLESAKLPLRKYQSNATEFIEQIDPGLMAESNSKVLGAESFVFVLGLVWFTESDELSVSIAGEELPPVVTKRVVLSEASKIFDVLGVLSPVTVRAKLILQDLWREDLQWDDPISESLNQRFVSYREDLLKLRNLSIARCLSNSVASSRKLIGFCDASAKAYCAVVYERSVDEVGNVNVSFVCSKTRVAPLKVMTIPRLELMSAVLLSKLIARIYPQLNVPKDNIVLFSDSTVVLSWLKMSTGKLKSFVANRVSVISELVSNVAWCYVRTTLNPADVGTRGVTAENLLQNRLWFSGPKELARDFESFVNVSCNIRCDIPETRKEKHVSLLSSLYNSLIPRYSSFDKLLNVICYMYRFIHAIRKLPSKCHSVVITVEERKTAMSVAVKLSQHNSFAMDLTRLVENRNLKKVSLLRSLSPFLDDSGIMRVGGRLKNTDLSFEKKHPIILSAKCWFVRVYLTYIHEKYFHCNKGVILANVVNKFWIVGGCANIVKRLIRECILCCRLKAVLGQQVMGNLPTSRVSVSRPFSHVGIDFAGHFNTKCLKHRSTKTFKVYAAFFVCFCTRAVHIELVSDLTTENFVEALQRFISRRGRPVCLYSDNGRNFVGANNLFKSQRAKLQSWATREMIDWKFIIPRTPHQGGLWESAIKSGKSLLVKATKNSVLTYEELSTVVCRIESILNSRPLCYQVKPDDAYEVITPGHFLIGDSLLNSAENLDDLNLNVGTRLRSVRSILNSFWKQWQSCYLNELQRRNKWRHQTPNLTVGDIVVIKEDHTRVLDWPMGRVVETFADAEGVVRNCNIKTSSGIVTRNVVRIVKLINAEGVRSLSPPE